MGALSHCVTIGDKTYCWDSASEKVVEAKLSAVPNTKAPEEAWKAVMMQRFGLVDPKEGK
jgi:hypothetical protein